MSEFDHSKALKQWAEMEESNYPELRMLFHIPNGEFRPFKTGAKLKSMGTKSGVPDFCLPVRRGRFGTLWIELKNEEGKLSDNQKSWISALIQYGQAAGVCHSWEEARNIILKYLNLE